VSRSLRRSTFGCELESIDFVLLEIIHVFMITTTANQFLKKKKRIHFKEDDYCSILVFTLIILIQLFFNASLFL